MKRDTQEFLQHLRGVVAYDPETGKLWWTVDRNVNFFAGTPVNGRDKHGYVTMNTKGFKLLAHKVAWALHYGVWTTQHIDHINGDPSDNRIVNLREVSPATNLQNQRRAHKDSASGILGVKQTVGKKRTTWSARIFVDGESLHLGSFRSEESAKNAYIEAKRKFHAGCTI